MLQSSYRSLRRYFAPRPYMEIRLRVLRLRRWKVPLAVYRRRF